MCGCDGFRSTVAVVAVVVVVVVVAVVAVVVDDAYCVMQCQLCLSSSSSLITHVSLGANEISICLVSRRVLFRYTLGISGSVAVMFDPLHYNV